ncbi:hypothetical protein [Actinoplanes sp. HUAS TT8]|uniref:hypothetical protein n=1 Tax=Actinoplanes sp. HUAS TT8 TaxID=3447453 RepID=UPI003F51F603
MIAWTIADLDGRARPVGNDVAEALQLRTGHAGPAPVATVRRESADLPVPAEDPAPALAGDPVAGGSGVSR